MKARRSENFNQDSETNLKKKRCYMLIRIYLPDKSLTTLRRGKYNVDIRILPIISNYSYKMEKTSELNRFKIKTQQHFQQVIRQNFPWNKKRNPFFEDGTNVRLRAANFSKLTHFLWKELCHGLHNGENCGYAIAMV